MVNPASEKILSDVKVIVLRVILNYLPQKNVFIFLFGSQVSKEEFSASDIDVGLLCDDKVDNSILVKIKDEIAEKVRTLRHIDLIDFNTVNDKLFLESALRRIIIWHETPKSKIYLDNLKKRLAV